MTPQALLTCLAFRSPKYMYRAGCHGLNTLFVFIFRGIIGGLLIFAMANWANPDIRWHKLTSSAWAWLFYLVMFIFGFAFNHILVWGFMIMLPLDWLGYLKPILEWIYNVYLAFIVIGILIIYSIGQSFNTRFPRRHV